MVNRVLAQVVRVQYTQAVKEDTWTENSELVTRHTNYNYGKTGSDWQVSE